MESLIYETFEEMAAGEIHLTSKITPLSIREINLSQKSKKFSWTPELKSNFTDRLSKLLVVREVTLKSYSTSGQSVTKAWFFYPKLWGHA